MNEFNQTPNEYQSPNDGESLRNAAESAAPQNGVNPSESAAGQVSFYESSEYISPVYVTKKRGFNPLAVIIPAAALIIAAAAAFIMLMLNKPASYREAERNFFGGLFSAAEQTEDGIYGQIGSEKLTVDFSTPLGDLAGIDLSQYKLEIDAVGGENADYGLLKAALGENMTLNAEIWRDRISEKTFFFMPEISDIYLVQDYSQKPDTAKDYSGYAEGLQAVIEKTSEVYFEITGDPETVKNAEFTVNGASYTADMAVIHLDVAQMATVYKAFLENMAENPQTAELLCQTGEFDTLEEMREEISALTDELQKSIDGTADADASLDMNVYMKNNTVIGREMVISNNSSEKVCIDFYAVPLENAESGYFRFTHDTGDEYALRELSLSYEDRTEGGAHSGNISLITDDGASDGSAASITAVYSDLALDENSFGGVMDITVNGGAQSDLTSLGIQSEYSAKITFSQNGEKKLVSFAVPNICTVNLTLEPSDIEFKPVPSPDPDKTAVVYGDEESDDYEALEQFSEDLQNYLQSCFLPDYGEEEDYPYFSFPEEDGMESEEYPPYDAADTSIIAGDWSPVKMSAFDEEYDLNSEEFGDIKGLVYSFSADGVLTVISDTYDTEVYNCRWDSENKNKIILEDDIYTSVYYDEASDSLLISDDSGIITIRFERK